MAGKSFARAGHTVSSMHDRKVGLVTVPGKPGDDVAPGTLNSVLTQAGLKP